ncbi:unnamed protein product [Pleuronectes platessa]|uniref:Uncharacterized protein n=1 Tax=Pleuronectes platessa TaxID=8262 RepID=A0A9N7UZS7_PLEPL|nr:unnamed protein product [Pleuronectes platessa]
MGVEVQEQGNSGESEKGKRGGQRRERSMLSRGSGGVDERGLSVVRRHLFAGGKDRRKGHRRGRAFGGQNLENNKMVFRAGAPWTPFSQINNPLVIHSTNEHSTESRDRGGRRDARLLTLSVVQAILRTLVM